MQKRVRNIKSSSKLMPLKLLFIAIIALPCSLNAQVGDLVKIPFPEQKVDTSTEVIQDIYLFYKSSEQGLMLRWAPSNPGTWVLGNEHGYTVEKILLDETDNKTFIKLTPKAIEPWPLKKWEEIHSEGNPYPAVAAMGIHGKDKSMNDLSIVDQSMDLANKFGFCLLAADLDRKTAEASGLYFLDTEVPKDKFYVYRVYIVDKKGNPLSDTTSVFLVHSEPSPFSGAYLANAIEEDGRIILQWDRGMAGSRPSGYFIERSDDKGRTYQRLNKLPYLDISTNLMQDEAYVRYTDSVDKSYVPYSYRIISLDAFGDESLPGNVITAMSRDRTPPQPPQNVKSTETSANEVKLTWEYPSNLRDIAGFEVYRVKDLNEQGNFELLSKRIPYSQRLFIDKNPDQRYTNYYVVKAIDTAGNAASSLIVSAITTDAIPPGPPTKLRASIDTSGQLLLEWNAPADNDIRGYLVYFSNDDQDEYFAVATESYLPNTMFVDKMSLQTLTEEIYYYVVAVDYSYNTSVASAILEVKKPDIIPPVPSLFTNYEVSEKGIAFTWSKSSSEDVARVELRRRTLDEDWQIIRSFNDKSDSYLDKNLVEGTYYEYSLITFDDDGNSTASPSELKISALKSFYLKNTPQLTAVSTKGGISVSITYPNDPNISFTLYRSENTDALTTYEMLGTETKFVDERVRSGQTYTYTVKAVTEDGRESKLSQQVVVRIR